MSAEIKDLLVSTRPEEYLHRKVYGGPLQKFSGNYWLASGQHEGRFYELIAMYTVPVGVLAFYLKACKVELYALTAQITEEIPNIPGDPVPPLENIFSLNIVNGVANATMRTSARLPVEPAYMNLGSSWQGIQPNMSAEPIDRLRGILEMVTFQPYET